MTDCILIDGDMLVYRSCVAVEKDTTFDNRHHILYSDANEAWSVLQYKLEELSEVGNTEDFVFTFSDPKVNFRKDLVGADYKSNREGLRKPLAYWNIREQCEDMYESVSWPTLEADDVMGILMTQELGENYILWSLDKDLKQIPGRHIREDVVVNITPEEGEYFFYYQVLAGDVSDGYSGCPGVGDKTARKLLDEHGATWDTVLAAYAKKGLSEADALYNAQMARILQDKYYVDEKVVFWTPN